MTFYCRSCDYWVESDHPTAPHQSWGAGLHSRAYLHPLYRQTHMLWHRAWRARERLHPLHVIFTHRYERLTALMRERSAALLFMDANPWILAYAAEESCTGCGHGRDDCSPACGYRRSGGWER